MIASRMRSFGANLAEYGLALGIIVVVAIPALTVLSESIQNNLQSVDKKNTSNLVGLLEKSESTAAIYEGQKDATAIEGYYDTSNLHTVFSEASAFALQRDSNGLTVVMIDGVPVETVGSNGTQLVLGSIAEMEAVLKKASRELEEPSLLALARAGHDLGQAMRNFDSATETDKNQWNEEGVECKKPGKKSSCKTVKNVEPPVRKNLGVKYQAFGSAYAQTELLLRRLNQQQKEGTVAQSYVQEVQSLVNGYSQVISNVTYDNYFSPTSPYQVGSSAVFDDKKTGKKSSAQKRSVTPNTAAVTVIEETGELPRGLNNAVVVHRNAVNIQNSGREAYENVVEEMAEY